MWALNSLYSGNSEEPRRLSFSRTSMAQREVLQSISEAIARCGVPPGGLDASAALAELRGPSPYEGGCTATASYQESLMSWPEAGSLAAPIADLLGSEGSNMVARFVRDEVLPEPAAEANLAASSVKQVHWDPKLSKSNTYKHCVSQLDQRGLIDYS